jgi:hypothetical protein
MFGGVSSFASTCLVSDGPIDRVFVHPLADGMRSCIVRATADHGVQSRGPTNRVIRDQHEDRADYRNKQTVDVHAGDARRPEQVE